MNNGNRKLKKLSQFFTKHIVVTIIWLDVNRYINGKIYESITENRTKIKVELLEGSHERLSVQINIIWGIKKRDFFKNNFKVTISQKKKVYVMKTNRQKGKSGNLYSNVREDWTIQRRLFM